MPKYNSPHFESTISPIQLDIDSAIERYQNVGVRQAQIDNINADTRKKENQAINEDIRKALYLATIEGTQSKTAGTKLENKRKTALSNYFDDVAKSEAQIKREQARRSEHETETARFRSLAEKEEALFKKYRNEFAKIGVTSSDSLQVRMMVKALADRDWETCSDLRACSR